MVGYLDVLRQWNARMNLTALEGDAALDRLIVEPALASHHLDEHAAHLVDIGTGGGSPAIPLKIMRPDLRLTMVEVRMRKSVFLREVARHLRLTDTAVKTSPFRQALETTVVRPIDVISARAIRLDTTDLGVIAQALRPRGQLLWFLSDAQQSLDMPSGIKLEQVVALTSSSELAVARSHG